MAGDRLGPGARETVTPAGRARITAPHRPGFPSLPDRSPAALPKRTVVFGRRPCGVPGFACTRPSGVAVSGGKVQGSVVVSLPPDAGTGRVPMTLGRPAAEKIKRGKGIGMPSINYLTRVEFDFGAIEKLPEIMDLTGIERPMIVTDQGLIHHGLVDRIKSVAPLFQETEVFADTPANPTEAAVNSAFDRYRAAGCDGLVAIGGGSPIDLAKAVAILDTHGGPLAQFAAIEGGIDRLGPVVPLVAVPTTAGTGSEVGRGALITLADGRKLALISPHLIPHAAVCDPELTLDLPPGLTAATGLDAISHCIETYLSPLVNPVADAIALDGLARAVASIETARKDGQDRAARWNMMMAALQGGLTFQKGLGAIHALSHPLGAIRHVSLHHGTLNAILLPHVLEWNETACGPKYAKIRWQLGLAADTHLPSFFRELNARLNLPSTLAALGVRGDDLTRVAEAAVLDHTASTNPRQLSVDDYRAVLTAAMGNG
ncbi:MAG: iron-containing alcohol dehydrogenase [Rhodobacteraceae bacterium]|nr:iron-containing alcohol dehydrogenase [Paracoccaceae bacterium]